MLLVSEDEALADETLHLVKPRHKRCDLRDQADIVVSLHRNRTVTHPLCVLID